jgi:hypothetical protein
MLARNAGGLVLDALDFSFHRYPVRGDRHHLDEAVPRFRRASAAAVVLALRRLELSIAYAIWSGVGTALTVMIGIAYFREPLTAMKLASIAFVVIGVGGLSLAGKGLD